MKLIEHQNECHCANIIVSKHCFTNRSEFEIWKKQEEESSKSLYVQHSGAGRMYGHNRKKYYYCHRSGQFRSRGKGLRNLKVQGSVKVGDYCTAHMTMSEDTITSKVTVLYCKHHNNHNQVDQVEGKLGLVEVDALTDEGYVPVSNPMVPSVNGDFEMNNSVETANEDRAVHENDLCYAKVLQQPTQKMISRLEAKRDLLQTVAKLRVLVEGCSDTETLIAINEHLSAAISVMKAATEVNQPQAAIIVRKRPASNTNSEYQSSAESS